MTLHVCEDTAENEINIWVTEVPADFSDADVRYNVALWADGGDAVAARALQLVPDLYWLSMTTGMLKDPTVRVYWDGAIKRTP